MEIINKYKQNYHSSINSEAAFRPNLLKEIAGIHTRFLFFFY